MSYFFPGKESLTDFSRRFADLLFVTYPEWQQFASADNCGELIVKVPAQNKMAEEGLLVIWDNGDEITVAFDRYHCHFMQEEEQAFELAIEFLEDLLSERRVVLIYFDENQKLVMSSSRKIDEPWLLPKQNHKRVVRSWNGNLDAELIG